MKIRNYSKDNKHESFIYSFEVIADLKSKIFGKRLSLRARH